MQIFEIIQRPPKTEDYPVVELGLMNVGRAIELMGGCVEVESEPENGSKFEIEVPQA